MPDGAKALPVAGVAPENPVLDGLPDVQSVDEVVVHKSPEARQGKFTSEA
jgi:hypothetical protein